eukprot:1564755-Rhodomonas_salina.1
MKRVLPHGVCGSSTSLAASKDFVCMFRSSWLLANLSHLSKPDGAGSDFFPAQQSAPANVGCTLRVLLALSLLCVYLNAHLHHQHTMPDDVTHTTATRQRCVRDV